MADISKIRILNTDYDIKDETARNIIDKQLYSFGTLNEMTSSTLLKNGDFAKTLGFYEINDGGSALYKIKKHTDEVVNNYSIFAITNTDLIAELIIEDYIDVKQFGAYGDNIHDDTNAFKNCITFAKNTITGYKPLTAGININIPSGTYIISDTLKIDIDGISIIGESYSSSIINAVGFDGIIFDFSKNDLSALYRNSLKNLTILSRILENEKPVHVYTYKLYHGSLEKLRLYGYYNGIEIWNGGKTFLNNIILGTYQGGEYTNIGITLDGSDIHLNDIQIQPDLTNYLYALECKNIDGLYVLPYIVNVKLLRFFNNLFLSSSCNNLTEYIMEDLLNVTSFIFINLIHFKTSYATICCSKKSLKICARCSAGI